MPRVVWGSFGVLGTLQGFFGGFSRMVWGSSGVLRTLWGGFKVLTVV